MILFYYPDTDMLDVHFHTPGVSTHDTHQEAIAAAREMLQGSTKESRDIQTETYEAHPSGQILAHYSEEHLDGLTIEYASRRAPKAWDVESLRREAAQVAASTGRIVESVTHDLIHDRTSFQTAELGPQSPHTSDEAVREYNQMIDEIETASAAA